MARWWTTTALAIGVTVGSGGCTAYVPKAGPRVAETSEGYHRGEEVVSHGVLDTGLVDAVRGNPEAEGYAKKYRSLQISGFVFDVAGLGLAVGGVFPLVNGNNPDPNDPYQTNPGPSPLGLGLLVGGVALFAVGLTLQAAAGPAKLDALNTYNDGVLGFAAPRAPDPVSAPPAPTSPSPPASGAGCTRDTDCKGDRICVKTECVDAPRPRR
jgi:hypothetical protein